MKSQGFLKVHGLNSLKLAAAVLSGGAALLSIISYLDSHHWIRLSRSAGLERAGFANPAVAWIGVLPAADTAYAIGDTIHLAVTVADHKGLALMGIPVGWASDDPAVAVVDSTGTVITRSAGITSITVSAEARSARARILVSPRPRALGIESGDSVLRIPEGESRPIHLHARDARGNDVVGVSGSWHSAAPDIAAVDSLGRLSGLDPGRTTLQATLGDLSAQVTVDVLPVPASLTLLTGGNQRVAAGQRLPQPVTIQVVSRHGRPVPGIEVRFTLPESAGRTDAASATTDEAGRAHTAWMLGEVPGRQPLAVEVAGIDPLRVVAEADPVRANTRVGAANDSMAGAVGQALSEPVSVRATDSSGVALADLPVIWATLDGGSVTALDARTDSLGLARARWILGPKAGRQRLRAQVGNPRTLAPVLLVADARAGAPALLRPVVGDKQSGRVGVVLPNPVGFQVTDSSGNPIAGITLRIQASAGSVADSVLTTDVNGKATVRWTLGRAPGPSRLMAQAAGIHSANAVASAVPGVPASLSAAPAPVSGVAGHSLEKPLRLTVRDEFGNPVPGAAIGVRLLGGNVSPARPVSDQHGEAILRWTLSGKAGPQALKAEVKGTAARVEVMVQAKSVAAPRSVATVAKSRPAVPAKKAPSPVQSPRSPFGTPAP